MTRPLPTLLAASLLALGGVSAGIASTFVAMADDELVGRSVAVVEGEVLRVDSFWNDDGTVIVSEAAVEVRDVVLGRDVPAVVTVRTFGGTVGSYRIEAHGFPTFRAGDRVVLFLEPAVRGDAAALRLDAEPLRVTGYQLGHYEVRRGADGTELAVPTLEPGVRLLTPAGRVAPRPATLPLAELKARVREIERDRAPIVR